MSDTTFYLEVDDMSVDGQGNKSPAGLLMRGFCADDVKNLTDDAIIRLAAEITGFAPERLHLLSPEEYVRFYGSNDERTNNDD